MEPVGSWHLKENVPLSTPFLPIYLRLNIIFFSHLYQFLPSDIMPLESNVPYTQVIPHCICTQFLLLCSEQHPLVYILNKLMLVHTIRHISGRFILILAFIVCLGFVLVTWNFGVFVMRWQNCAVTLWFIMCTEDCYVHSYIAGIMGWHLWHQISS